MVLGLLCFSLPSWVPLPVLFERLLLLTCLPCLPFLSLSSLLCDCCPALIVCSCARFPAASRCVISPVWRDVFAPCACLCIPLSSIFLWVSVSCSLNKCINYSKLAFSLDLDCFILMDLFENLITVQALLQGWNCFVTRDGFRAAYSVFDSVRGIWMNGSQKTNSLLFLVLDGKH